MGTDWREPTADERELIRVVLLSDFPEREILRRELAASRVQLACDCGCGSLQFEVRPPRELANDFQLELDGLTPSGGHTLVVLRLREVSGDRVIRLEVTRMGHSDPIVVVLPESLRQSVTTRAEGGVVYQELRKSAVLEESLRGGARTPTLHLMVGLPCSGKTTLARRLEHELPALRLTVDPWHIRLFGQDAEEPEHDARHSLIEAMLWDIASRALELGTNVILDYGFWAREEREDYRARAQQLGARSEVHFLDVPEEELLARLERRNERPSQETFVISAEAMTPWIAFFQKPTPDELERRD